MADVIQLKELLKFFLYSKWIFHHSLCAQIVWIRVLCMFLWRFTLFFCFHSFVRSFFFYFFFPYFYVNRYFYFIYLYFPSFFCFFPCLSLIRSHRTTSMKTIGLKYKCWKRNRTKRIENEKYTKNRANDDFHRNDATVKFSFIITFCFVSFFCIFILHSCSYHTFNDTMLWSLSAYIFFSFFFSLIFEYSLNARSFFSSSLIEHHI